MAFWNTWETWAKMTFILACSIVAVLVFSLGIRWRNKRRIKRYSECTAPDTAERGEMTETARQEQEVPFGIRAIERGCEVDGVWNSKTNTPLQTPTHSTPSSPVMRPKDFGSDTDTARLSADQQLQMRPKGSASDTDDTAKLSPDQQLPMRGRRAYQPKTLSGNISYPPSSYPSSASSRCRSYPVAGKHIAK